MVRRRTTKVYVPGGAKRWTDVLPKEYRDNPYIIVVSVKQGAKTRITRTPDGYSVGILESKLGNKGLQVIGGGGNYLDHQDLIEKHYRVPMADPSYIGPLLKMPDRLLTDDRLPLIFLRDKMGQPYLNLKHWLYFISEGNDEQRN
jgi:hypothetical protein